MTAERKPPTSSQPGKRHTTEPIDWTPLAKALTSQPAHRNVNNVLSIGWAVAIIIMVVVIAYALR